MSFQLLILISVFCFAAHSLAWKLQDNVYIIDSEWTPRSPPKEVKLHCNVSGEHNTSIYWKKDSKTVGLENRNGTLEIKVKEAPHAGNFTCWSGATSELLSYTTLYIAKIIDGKIKHEILSSTGSSNFRCTANNYSHFTCSWTIAKESQHQSLKFSVRSLNIDNTSGSITCEEPVRDSLQTYSVSCKKETTCPATEEYQKNVMVLDVFDKNVYENDTHSFFLKDILKPDVTECKIERGEKSWYRVTWKPPNTWSSPESYFPLTYEIKTVGATVQICTVDNPTSAMKNGNFLSCLIKMPKDGKCSIRSRDSFSVNSWSEWSKPCRVPQKNLSEENHHTSNDKIKRVECRCEKN